MNISGAMSIVDCWNVVDIGLRISSGSSWSASKRPDYDARGVGAEMPSKWNRNGKSGASSFHYSLDTHFRSCTMVWNDPSKTSSDPRGANANSVAYVQPSVSTCRYGPDWPNRHGEGKLYRSHVWLTVFLQDARAIENRERFQLGELIINVSNLQRISLQLMQLAIFFTSLIPGLPTRPPPVRPLKIQQLLVNRSPSFCLFGKDSKITRFIPGRDID